MSDQGHPATLTTKADFASAPAGTIITYPYWGVAIKDGEDEWVLAGEEVFLSITVHGNTQTQRACYGCTDVASCESG